MRPPLTIKDLATRKNGTGMGVAGLATLGFISALVYGASYLQQVYNGPETASLTQIIAMGPDAAGRWFDVTSDVRANHILRTTTRRRRGGETVTNHFALIKDAVVIVETSASQLGPKFKAWASEFAPDSSYYGRSRSQLNTWQVSRPLAPVMLTTSLDVTASHWFHGIGIGAISLGLLYLLARFGRMLLDYTRTPELRALKKSARANEGIPTLIAEVDQQLAARDPTARRSGIMLLPSWLMNVSRNSFSLMSAADAVWIAPYTVKKKTFGFTTSTNNEIRIFGRTGKPMAFTYPEASTVDALRAFHHWAPWAVVGADDALERRFGKVSFWKRFKKQPSKADILKVIDERRAAIMAERVAPAAQAPSVAT